MGQTISDSIDGLGAEISGMTTALSDSINYVGDRVIDVSHATQKVVDGIQSVPSAITSELRLQRERHDRALEMLDNIQRQRKPMGISWRQTIETKPTSR